MASKFKKITIAVILLGVVGYWYYSPYISIKQMQRAAAAHDADAFSSHVDYPKIRESIKGQMATAIADKMGPTENTGFAALGTAIGMAFIGTMVDTMVRPEFIMKAMEEGKYDIKQNVAKGGGIQIRTLGVGYSAQRIRPSDRVSKNIRLRKTTWICV